MIDFRKDRIFRYSIYAADGSRQWSTPRTMSYESAFEVAYNETLKSKKTVLLQTVYNNYYSTVLSMEPNVWGIIVTYESKMNRNGN